MFVTSERYQACKLLTHQSSTVVHQESTESSPSDALLAQNSNGKVPNEETLLRRLETRGAPDRTSSVDRPPCWPNRMSVSRRSPTMQIWPRCSPNCAAMLASMNSAGLPTTIGSRFTAPGPHPRTRLHSPPCDAANCSYCSRLSASTAYALHRAWAPWVHIFLRSPKPTRYVLQGSASL